MTNYNRDKIIQIIIFVVFSITFIQLFHLQLLNKKYKEAADNNSIYRKIIYPDRGIIYSKSGKSLLENKISYDLIVTPIDIKKLDTHYLCSLLGISMNEFKRRMNQLIYKNSRVKPSVFEAVLSPYIYSQLYENLYKFQGFNLIQRTVRYYPSSVGAHFLGYLAEVDSNFLKRQKNQEYELGDYVGVTGLEKEYESTLKGIKGMNRLLRNNKGQLQGEYENGKYDTAPISGRNIYTGIDIEVQKLAEELLNNKIGSLVAINPKNGLIIALASNPSFNPNSLIGPNRRDAFVSMLYDTSKPLYNRAIKGMYPPGSTYKPLGGLIGLAENTISPSWGYPCTGAYYGCGAPRNCEHKNSGHAKDLVEAIANSCNSYFLQVFRNTIDNAKYGSVIKGYEVWKKYVNDFGLGEPTHVDIPGENIGNIYTVDQYKRDFLTDDWNSCFLLTLGIGQDRMTMTPLQLAKMTAIIAEKGKYYIPHFVDSIESPTESELAKLKKYKILHSVPSVSSNSYKPIIDGMFQVTQTGTAAFIKIPGIEYCAKTGTAQNPHGKNHSIFICFAPKDDPQIAVAVVIENAGFGSTWAGPIGSFIMEKYLNDTIAKERQPLLLNIKDKFLIPNEIYKKMNNGDLQRKKMFSLEKNFEISEVDLEIFNQNYSRQVLDSIFKNKSFQYNNKHSHKSKNSIKETKTKKTTPIIVEKK